jgi:hypothetical protein
VLVNVIDDFKNMFILKPGRIYNIFNRENLDLLLRKTVRKKKREKDILSCKEEVMHNYLEKISKNWKTRRKKPPDKIIEVKFSSLNMKEYNLN